MLSVRLPVSSRLLEVTFLGESKVIHAFLTTQGLVPLNPVLFKAQLYNSAHAEPMHMDPERAGVGHAIIVSFS